MLFSAFLCLVPSIPLSSALQLSGNQNYARDSRRLLRKSYPSSLVQRSAWTPAYQPSSVTFSIGSKEYLSPTGPEFKTYTLDEVFGLEGYAGKTVLVTVMKVDEGNVSCDILGKMVEEYTKKDDVWDQVRALPNHI